MLLEKMVFPGNERRLCLSVQIKEKEQKESSSLRVTVVHLTAKGNSGLEPHQVLGLD